MRPKGKGRKLDAENADAAEFAAGCDMPQPAVGGGVSFMRLEIPALLCVYIPGRISVGPAASTRSEIQATGNNMPSCPINTE